MKLRNFGFLMLPLTLALLSSCLNNDDEYGKDYAQWRVDNNNFINAAEAEMLNGTKRYEKVVPKWDPASYVLMQWHKRGNSGNDLTPLDNSTIKVKYLLTSIEGDTIDSSYKQTDSLFSCKPCEMITGFWIATTSMHVGDSVTTVIPYTCGYGATGSGNVLPYSTLIFQIKLSEISGYDKPSWRP